MKFELIGKVTSRTYRKFKNRNGMMQDVYQLEVEEQGIYTQTFLCESFDPSIFGQADGPFAIGKFVKVTGFGNCKKCVSDSKDENGVAKKSYFVHLNIRTLEPIEANATDTKPSNSDAVSDDIPF